MDLQLCWSSFVGLSSAFPHAVVTIEIARSIGTIVPEDVVRLKHNSEVGASSGTRRGEQYRGQLRRETA
jgi:hypothetical protein